MRPYSFKSRYSLWRPRSSRKKQTVPTKKSQNIRQFLSKKQHPKSPNPNKPRLNLIKIRQHRPSNWIFWTILKNIRIINKIIYSYRVSSANKIPSKSTQKRRKLKKIRTILPTLSTKNQRKRPRIYSNLLKSIRNLLKNRENFTIHRPLRKSLRNFRINLRLKHNLINSNSKRSSNPIKRPRPTRKIPQYIQNSFTNHTKNPRKRYNIFSNLYGKHSTSIHPSRKIPIIFRYFPKSVKNDQKWPKKLRFIINI